LYESVKDEPNKRSKIFSKLGRPIDDYELIPILGELIRYEITHNKPCGKPSNHIVKRDYSINKKLADKQINLTKEQLELTEKFKVDFDIIFDILKSGLTSRFSNSSLSDAEKQMKQLIDGKINNSRYINHLLKIYKHNGAELPSVDELSKEYVAFRYCQVYTLWMTDIRSRYNKLEDIFDHENAILRLKHDVHDINYLINALLEGAFATNEVKLIKWFKLLHPDGHLITGA
jgi:hypothetical protein